MGPQNLMATQEFIEKTWSVVAGVPAGKVVAYGQVAKMAGFSGYARQVGATLKALPAETKLPWHRVVNAQGRLSFAVGSGPYERQRKLLEAEGIIFKGDKIPSAFFWC